MLLIFLMQYEQLFFFEYLICSITKKAGLVSAPLRRDIVIIDA